MKHLKRLLMGLFGISIVAAVFSVIGVCIWMFEEHTKAALITLVVIIFLSVSYAIGTDMENKL